MHACTTLAKPLLVTLHHALHAARADLATDHCDTRRDFFYTFSGAPDIVPAENGRDALEYQMSGQDSTTGEMPEGGGPPRTPGLNCNDNGPFLAHAVAAYATL